MDRYLLEQFRGDRQFIQYTTTHCRREGSPSLRFKNTRPQKVMHTSEKQAQGDTLEDRRLCSHSYSAWYPTGSDIKGESGKDKTRKLVCVRPCGTVSKGIAISMYHEPHNLAYFLPFIVSTGHSQQMKLKERELLVRRLVIFNACAHMTLFPWLDMDHR